MTTLNEHNAKVVVLDFLNALNTENFDLAKEQLDENMTFKGVMGERTGADNYINDMKKMKFKYNIQKLFADDHEVSVFFDINMGEKTIFSSGWYTLENEKIKSIKVLFDPRPLL
ncbi:nuclear transport factor 2 family protein [Pedobacter punctiformis]|uniref:Nuclear transport factor 2 family protein n=1 Tax=Pedobacter punctiformis TaxID=3004097 RepID=A0ABT4L499_9SPHI|nr:nuclear transport factor 2 family protein [Pedobacter sp. HCMS5-2]MCZ4242749.1 nuclear transport factor 2 family protein [Pedobacter sp. HCMS5-2]